MILEIFRVVWEPVKMLWDGWQKKKQAEIESALAIEKAKTEANIKRMDTEQQGDIAWQNTSINNSGWKDEWFTVVLSIPAIMCFIPGLADYVTQGFKALQTTPEWYQWAFLVAVASSFGYKKLADWMSLKKGV
jgi:hypothetical protein